MAEDLKAKGEGLKVEGGKLTGLVVEWWHFFRVLSALCGEIGDVFDLLTTKDSKSTKVGCWRY
jgi:hypothetical protein